MDWTTVIVGLVSAAIAATPGVLAYRRQQRADQEDVRLRTKAEKREDQNLITEGMARLASELREQLDRERQECKDRIARVEHDLLSRIVDLEAQLNGHPASG